MDYYWKQRKSDWFRGGHVRVNELLRRYYLWEVEPMCDSYNKCVDSTGKWSITVRRSFCPEDEPRIDSCDEPFVFVDDLTKEVAMELYKKIMTGKYLLPAIKDMLETAKYEAEAVRLIP